ncbi:MAG: TonB-dependent receptor plug domain-containing protein [Spirochaetota bacterium]
MPKKFYSALFVILCSVLTVLAAPGFFAYGEEPSGSKKDFSEDPVFELEEVVVTATRTKTRILDSPAHVSVITEKDISDSGAKNIADLLSSQTGISVRDYGPEGSLKSLSIRGSSSEGVLVLLNGVRLNDSRSGSIDLSLIPMHNIERIEIVRGGTSALYGADAVGGVVNIITKKEAAGDLNVKLENRSYIPHEAVVVEQSGDKEEVNPDPMDLLDTQKLSIEYSKNIGEVDFTTSGSFTRAKNGFVWYDDSNINDYRKLNNADMLGVDMYTGIAVPTGTGTTEFTGLFSYNDKNVPGSTTYPLSDASQKDVMLNGSVQYQTPEIFSDFLTLNAKLNYKYWGLDYEDSYTDSLHKTNTANFDLSQKMFAFDSLTLIYGINLNYDSVESTDIGVKDRISGGIFIESPIYITPSFTLTPSTRYDYYSDFGNSLNFKLSSNYYLSSNSSLKVSVSKSSRAPTLNELYWPYIPPFLDIPGTEGNSNLSEESGYSLEAGISGIETNMRYDVHLFTRYMKEKIEWKLDGDNVYRPYNIGQTLYPGLEANGEINVFKNIWLNGNYTFIYSFVLKTNTSDYSLSDDKRAPYTPVHSLSTGVKYRGAKNLLGLDVQYQSKQYTDAANTTSSDSFVVVNADYKRNISDNFTLSLAVDNIFNTTYQTKYDYIMPPLCIRTGIEAQF